MMCVELVGGSKFLFRHKRLASIYFNLTRIINFSVKYGGRILRGAEKNTGMAGIDLII